MTDRRRPLGGVEKETYVHHADDSQKFAELTYDLLRGLKDDLCFKIDSIQKESVCRADECNKKFITKIHEKIPVSWFGFIVFFGGLCFLVGLGVLEWKKIVSICKLLAL